MHETRDLQRCVYDRRTADVETDSTAQRRIEIVSCSIHRWACLSYKTYKYELMGKTVEAFFTQLRHTVPHSSAHRTWFYLLLSRVQGAPKNKSNKLHRAFLMHMCTSHS